MNQEKRITILQTEHYAIDVDPHKNRLYARVLKKAEDAPEPSRFLEALHDVKHSLRNGFTMLVEQCEHETLPQDHVALIHDMLDLLYEGGIRKIAKVCPECSTPHESSSNLAMDPIDNAIQHKEFADRDAAEAWLDAA